MTRGGEREGTEGPIASEQGRVAVTARLSQSLAGWLEKQEGSQGRMIDAALSRHYRITLQEDACQGSRREVSASERIGFEFTNMVVRGIERVELGALGAIEVVGDPSNAAYEWVFYVEGRVESHSDAGYGQHFVALMDGLKAVLE